MIKLGSVDKNKFRKWCVSKNHLMIREKWFGKEIKEDRLNLWFGIGVNFDKNLSFETLTIFFFLRHLNKNVFFFNFRFLSRINPFERNVDHFVLKVSLV
jgi:hypothetical protein